ncbi:reductase [Steroidobacter agaridevorans]|nr:reductase [Steroidobacter agaridevorans]
MEQLTGDRNSDLESIKGRDWDAVIDTATYGPIWVRTLGQALKDRVGHYTFISTVGVYDHPGANEDGTDETNKRAEYKGADAYSITQSQNLSQYGELKALCETEAEKQFPERTLIVRPGTIVGPNDSGGVFTYWAMRIEAGGEILVAGDPLSPVQMVDVRDIAEWVIRMIEIGETGAFNLVGPALPLGWAEFLGALRGLSSSEVSLTWVPVEWVRKQGISSPLSSVLFWPAEVGFPGIMRMKNDKARSKGLTFRPISVTVSDTRAWFRNQAVDRQKQLLMGLDGTNKALEESMAIERELLAAWHSREN